MKALTLAVCAPTFVQMPGSVFGTMTAYECPGAARTARGVDDPKEVDVPNGTCSVDGCDRPIRYGGLCNMHRQRLDRERLLAAGAVCSVEGCEAPQGKARGLCHRHYQAWRQEHYKPAVLTADELRTKFWASVNKLGPIPEHKPDLGPCWEWTAAINGNGYGSLRLGLETTTSHRLAWEIGVGPIPDGMYVLHHCDYRPCVNYERHLFLGTHADNMRDATQKGVWQRRERVRRRAS